MVVRHNWLPEDGRRKTVDRNKASRSDTIISHRSSVVSHLTGRSN